MAFSQRAWAVAAAILAAQLSGCTSVRSTYFHRNDEDTKWKKNHIKGVPITLKVPTHIKIDIIETVYHDGNDFVHLDAQQILKTRNIATNYIYESKIFGVDFKRPAAGPYKMIANMSATNPQYFSDVDHELTDETIQRVGEAINSLVKTLLPKGIPGGVGQTAGVQASDATPLDTIICSQVFKIDAPDFENQVAAFLQASCCPGPSGMILLPPVNAAEGKDTAPLSQTTPTPRRVPSSDGVIPTGATVVRPPVPARPVIAPPLTRVTTPGTRSTVAPPAPSPRMPPTTP